MLSTHYSVLLNESIEMLNLNPEGIYVDATFGRGGHSQKILDQLSPKGQLIALDRDPAAKLYADEYFANSDNFYFYHSEMGKLTQVLAQHGVQQVDGILMDIGVSSPQLDEAERGFSFMKHGPLDMRMDPAKGQSAEEWIMSSDYETMVKVFREYGEERFASKIANKIIYRRMNEVIDSTTRLAEIIAEAMPYKDSHKHPATRVFQAIRIAINDELNELHNVLAASYQALNIGGRMVVISFHSLEDRIVKQFIQGYANPKDLFPELPIQVAAQEPTLKVIGKPKKAGGDECSENIRSRSAVMRVAEKIG